MEEVKLDKRVRKQIEATRKLQEELAARNQILLDSNDVDDEEAGGSSEPPVVDDAQEGDVSPDVVEEARPARKKSPRKAVRDVPKDPSNSQLCIYLPSDMKYELRLKTFKMGVTMSSYISELVRKDLARGKN